jgi:hypothetical protein
VWGGSHADRLSNSRADCLCDLTGNNRTNGHAYPNTDARPDHCAGDRYAVA